MRVKHIGHTLTEEFALGTYLRDEFPMLAEWGVEDHGLTMHSLGLNYLAALGRHANFWAVSEYPILPIAPSGSEPGIRTDVVWFDRNCGEIALLGEFERYEPAAMKAGAIRRKAENMVIAHHRLGACPRILLLALWTLSGIPVTGIGEIKTHLRAGFQDATGEWIPALGQEAVFFVVTFVFRRNCTGLFLGEVLV